MKFFFFFPSCISGVHHFGREFCVCDRFFNSDIGVVTFRLRGWCILGVFLLPAFTRLGHECQDVLCPRYGMHVCTDYTTVYTLIRKSCWGMEFGFKSPHLPAVDRGPDGIGSPADWDPQQLTAAGKYQLHTHTHARTHARPYARPHARTHARTHTRTHTHTHNHSLLQFPL